MARIRARKASKLNKFSKFWAIIYILTLLAFEFVMLMLDVIPVKILLIAFVVLIVISVVIFLQLFLDNIKRKSKIIALIISMLLMVIYGLFTFYAFGTMSFLNKVTTGGRNEKAAAVTREPFNVYISGIDKDGSIKTEGLSDVNMLLTVNPKTGKVLLTSIPRDYYVQFTDGHYEKLTHTGAVGIDETVKTAENLLDTDINYYIKVNFSTLTGLVNAIGGITVDSTEDFYGMPFNGTQHHFVKGENKLDGGDALIFARTRMAFSDGDNTRIGNQQLVAEAILKKMTGSATLLLKYDKILDAIAPYMETNFTKHEIKSLIKMQLARQVDWQYETYKLTGHDDNVGGAYVMDQDEASVQEARDKIEEVLADEPEKNNTGSKHKSKE